MKKDFIEVMYEKRKYIIAIGLILLLGISIYYVISSKVKNNNSKQNEVIVTTTLKIFGPKTISLKTGEEYDDPGYYAIDSTGKIRSDEIKVSSNFDKNNPGTYTVTYQIDDKTLTRTIEVTGEAISGNQNENDNNQNPLELSLNGDKVITLSVGDEYIEPGFLATSPDGKNINAQVKTTGEVNTSKPGEYTLTYMIEYNGEKKEVIRTVVVIDDTLVISVVPNKTTYTNSHVTFTIKVEGNSFQTLVFPNNVLNENKETTYDVTTNGTYTFTAYNINGKSFTKSVTVTNIDTESPTGSCLATINQTSTNIQVNGDDDLSGIANYIYYDNGTEILKSDNNFYNYNAKTSKIVTVTITDKAGNKTKINCNIEDKSALDPIKPGANEKIVKQGETDTLKVYITKKSKYYITRIWAYDPYHQLNKFDSPEYGKKLYRPKTLLKKAKEKYNLQNQLLVGFNASAFYLAGVYDASEVSKYSKYNKTSVGTLVITDGKVIRNAYNHAYKTRYIVGVDKDNQMQVFTDKSGTSKKAKEEKKKWAQEVIDSGIRNTFTHASILIKDYKKSSTKTNMPSPSTRKNRQAICQIDTNNFALITGENLNRSDLQNIMMNLKCRIGSNLDGGGSIALFFQDRGSNSISTIIGNKRDLTEVGYFSELN